MLRSTIRKLQSSRSLVASPNILGGLLHCLKIVVAPERELSSDHLVQHAAERPQIRGPVGGLVCENLGRYVLRGAAKFRGVERVLALRRGGHPHLPGSSLGRAPCLLVAERASTAKIGDLAVALVIQQHILWLQVTVNDSKFCVKVLEAFDDLCDEKLHQPAGDA